MATTVPTKKMRSFYACEKDSIIALSSASKRDAWVAADSDHPRYPLTRQEAEHFIGGRFFLDQLGQGDLCPVSGR